MLGKTKKQIPNMPSSKKFGIFFSAVLSILAAYYYFNDASRSAYGSFAFAVGLLIVSNVKPSLLDKINYAWFMLGELLGKFISPLVLGVIYFGLLTPVGLLAKAFGRDELKIRRTSKDVETYWVKRLSTQSNIETFNNQF